MVWLRTIVMLIALATALCPALGWGGAADLVRLRAQASVESGVVLLRDVAELSGAAAELGGVEVGRVEGEAATIGIDAVRSALSARKDINWGRLTFSGSACTVRALRVETAPEVGADSGRAELGAEVAAGDTVRAAVAMRIASFLGVGVEELQLSFDSRADALLDIPTRGRTVAVQPLGLSAKMALSVRVFDGERLLQSGTVRVGTQVRREVGVVRATVSRGRKLDEQLVSVETRWVGAGTVPADPAKLMGMNAKTSISVGTVLLESHAEPPILVKKGDKVSVDCLSGGFLVRVIARAMEAGRDGEEVRFQLVDSKTQFKARIVGPGRAVTTASDASGAGGNQ